jgi:glucose/arabinose dehydrogenase
MRITSLNRRLPILLPVFLASSAVACGAAELPLGRIHLPEGFTISAYSSEVPGARSLTLGAHGTLFVGTRTEGKVYALVDADGDHRAETVHILARGLRMPNGVAYRDGDLFVAEVSRLLRFPGIDRRLADPPEPEVVYDRLPRDRHHGWKFIAFGPDGLLYVPVGAPCNVCLREDERYAAILRFRPDGTFVDVYVHGVRNTVGFDWHPRTGDLWFTDNGRDWLGDDRPPDELNVATAPGQHFGFPYCHGGDIPDPEISRGRSCADFVPPALKLGPHVAGLGLRFYTAHRLPSGYRGDVFVAEHGSWNRSTPIGYRVVRVRVEGDRPVGQEVFAEGWLGADGKAWGRPVDVEIAPDGALLVSDDRAGAVYRIDYRGRGAGS